MEKTNVGFPVDDVELETDPMPSKNLEDIVKNHLENDSDKCKLHDFFEIRKEKNIVGSKKKNKVFLHHGLIMSAYVSYAHHYPLGISPDDIWLCIIQGLSLHVNLDPDKNRPHVIPDTYRQTIEITHDKIVLNSTKNDWIGVFQQFSLQIRDYIGEEMHDYIMPDFTTTGPNEKTAAEIVMMSLFKKYSDSRVTTKCGIPRIRLDGVPDDWVKLRQKAVQLARYDLGWWTYHLLPILDQFVDASNGKINHTFWSSLYKKINLSGGSCLSGWILKLFPYYCCGDEFVMNDFQTELSAHELPSGVSSVDFNWSYHGTTIPMKFFAGNICAGQDPSLHVSNVIGWFVGEKTNQQPFITR